MTVGNGDRSVVTPECRSVRLRGRNSPRLQASVARRSHLEDNAAMTTTTPTDLVTIVQRTYAAFGEGDIAGLLAHVDDDVEWSMDLDAPGAEMVPMFRQHRGHDGVRTYLDAVSELEVLAFEPREFLTGDRTVVARLRIHLRHPRTGKDVDLDELHLYEFGDDDRIVRYRPFSNTAGIIEIYRD